MKTCVKCRQRSNKKFYANICVDCKRAYNRERYRRKSGELKKQVLEYIANNPERRRGWQRKYRQSEGGRRNARRAQAKYQKKPDFIQKRKAHDAVRRAVEAGRLIRDDICRHCRAPTPVHGHHHKGYTKEHQLDVIWLCSSCHALEDNRLRAKRRLFEEKPIVP